MVNNYVFETRRADFYGDALGSDKRILYDCGTDRVVDQMYNSRIGARICKEYVEDRKTGGRCSECVDGYLGLCRGYCSDCKCDIDGSKSSMCDKFTGQCCCKANRGGLQCDQYSPGTYGDTNECQLCQYPNDEATSSKCDRQTDQRICKPGVA